MNSTNGTLSSENESLRGDMSYLFGRDPSILAYGQRPFPSHESKKNLISLLEEENENEELIDDGDKVSTSTEISTNQTIKVFLRLKPFSRKIKITPEQSEAYSILNSTTLLTKMPSLDNNTSCLKKIKPCEMVCRKFTFTQTFGPETSQLELFEQAVKPQMNDFLAGRNSVVMSYGTTNSGKTYTLQGTTESPGIIPRGIEYVFSNIDPRALPSYKPINLCDVIYLNTQDRLQEVDAKMKLLALNSVDKNCHLTAYKQMQRLLHEESPIRPSHNCNAHYSVWISFAEIYNETIYDLLRIDCHKKRPALKLATDNRGRAFIKGLKSICVNSGAEAYQVFMVGKYNLKVAVTALNSRSSRSHCIFTITLLKYRSEHDPGSVEVSTFAFCDLAGSERLKKTLNVGERLKEAQNINTSLLVLGRCLKTIYESQCSVKQKNESIGPFRESKLTRLFQRALSGKEQIALIVNVNPVPNLYVETQNVLNFSAIAKKIIIERTNIIKKRHSQTRFSRLVTQSMKTDMDWENTEIDDLTVASEEYTEQESDIEENDQESYEDLLIENEMLKNEIKELKASALKRDIQTRNEMTDVYTEIMKKLEEDWKSRLIDMEEQQEDLRELAVDRIELFYKEKLNQMNIRKRSRQSTDDEDEDDKKLLEDLEAENTRLTAKIETMKKNIRDLKHMKEAAESEKTKISFELAVLKEEAKRTNEMLIAAQTSIHSGGDISANYIEELNNIIKKKNERIKSMKTFLNEAKEEYISITDEAQKMENEIKQLHERLAVNKEYINDLEEQLGQANVYSAEQNKVNENLEEQLDLQTKKLIEAEEKVRNLSEQLDLLNSSDHAKNQEVEHSEFVNKEFEKTKELLDEWKLKFEFSEIENTKLKEKLNQRLNEIEWLRNNLDSTKNQLDKITEKVNSLTIDEFEYESEQKIKSENETEKKTESESESEQKTVFSEIGVQTEAYMEKSSDSNPNTLSISCQTNEIKHVVCTTEEKCLQTSFCLDEFANKEQIVQKKEIKIESVSIETFNELQLQYDEIKNILEMCQIEKINTQKHFEETIKELQNQINVITLQEQEKNEKISFLQNELEQIISNSEEERQNLKNLIEIQNSKNKNLEDEKTKAMDREQDKDKEISSLQKEMKNQIQSNEITLKNMESEIKNVLRDLASTQEQLNIANENNKKIDKEYKQNIYILEMKITSLEQKILEKQEESEKFKLNIEVLKKSLSDTEHELEVFTKNRDETVSKYEDLVKSQYNEIGQQKKEIIKLQELYEEFKENTLQTPFKESGKKLRYNKEQKKVKAEVTDLIENSSEDEPNGTDKIEKSNRKKEFLTPAKDNIPLINVSESESVKSVKSVTKAPPASLKRTRKKKLFTPSDDSFIDINEPPPSPCSSTRSLRNRKR